MLQADFGRWGWGSWGVLQVATVFIQAYGASGGWFCKGFRASGSGILLFLGFEV